MYHFQEQLPCSRVEDKYRAVDWFGREVALECFVDGHTVDIGVVDEPDDLVVEEVGVVLAV
jgi:hypothetical protein